jgi:hypothetical protein
LVDVDGESNDPDGEGAGWVDSGRNAADRGADETGFELGRTVLDGWDKTSEAGGTFFDASIGGPGIANNGRSACGRTVDCTAIGAFPLPGEGDGAGAVSVPIGGNDGALDTEGDFTWASGDCDGIGIAADRCVSVGSGVDAIAGGVSDRAKAARSNGRTP